MELRAVVKKLRVVATGIARGGVVLAGVVLASGGAITARAETAFYEEPPISYSATAARDAVSRLNDAIDKGTAAVGRDERHGYLEALLRELRISPSSQMLVFSKTSFQRS